jgi:L-malate glycosyltransferase
MKNYKVMAPLGRGGGAFVVHKLLERQLPNYHVVDYNPWWTLFPFALGMAAPIRGADIVHTTQDYGIFFQKKDTPIVLTLHGYILDPWMHAYSSLAQRIHYATDLRLITWISLLKADVITAVSHFMAQVAREDLGIIKPIRVIYNGIDTDFYTPLKTPRPARKEVKVFVTGNLTLRKGVQFLPDIASRLDPGITIYYTPGLRTTFNLENIPNLQPMGRVPFKDLPDRYRDMDILLMPTVREGFGLSVAEAMATGIPVVASDCSSIPELIDNGKGGFLCPVGDGAAFAQRINLLAQNPGIRKEMGDYNRAKVEQVFRLDQMVENYKRLFEEILDTKGSYR